jgi:hypothetical protein
MDATNRAAFDMHKNIGIDMMAVQRILDDGGRTARLILGDQIPGQFGVTDLAVERFADAFQITWDQARALLTSSGEISRLVMGEQIPAAATRAADSLKLPRQGVLDLADTIKMTGNPAIDSFNIALSKIPEKAMAASQAWRDMVAAMDANQVASGPGGSSRQYASEQADIGVHSAMDEGGNVYTIDKTYAQMTQEEKDDANDFAHQYPGGLHEGGIVMKDMLAQLHAPEAVIPLDRMPQLMGSGIDYDKLAAAIVRAQRVNPPRVAIEDVRSALLRIGARNGGIVGLA